MPHIEFLADKREAGQTVAAVLRGRFGLTWTQAQRLVERGHVRVAGFAVSDPAHRVKNRNRVWVREGTVEVKKPTGSAQAAAPPVCHPRAGRRPSPWCTPTTRWRWWTSRPG